MEDLLHKSLQKSKYVLLSYNNEGIIQEEGWESLLKNYRVTVHEIKYDTYKGGRNLKKRENKVMEKMFLIQKK